MTESTVHVAVYDTLADWEIGYLTAYLRNGLYQRPGRRFGVVTVGPTREPVTTMGGLRVTPDVALAEVAPADSAMLVLAGARSWDEGEQLAPFAAKARDFLDAGTPVAAICGATYGLAAAGVLDDRPHTSAAPQYLAASGYAGGAHYVDAPAVDADGLITATPVAPIDFARAVFARLDAYEPRVLDAWYRLQTEHDPEAFYELAGA